MKTSLSPSTSDPQFQPKVYGEGEIFILELSLNFNIHKILGWVKFMINLLVFKNTCCNPM